MDTNRNYRCVVIDDEDHAIELLADYIAATPRLQLEKTFQDPVAALMDSAPEVPYDFIFLDIDMPRLTGLELAKSLRSRTRFLVFTTAHQKYALEAYDVRADHFLLKPISMNKFALTVDLLLKSTGESNPDPVYPDDDSFFIKSDQKNKLIRIQLHEIVCIEGLKNYVLIHTLTQKHIAYLTLKEMEDALCPTGRFLRVHKSFIVANQHIERVEGRTIHLKNNLDIPIGETYKPDFYSYIGGKILRTGR
ncbi:LytR/AlgR family response regulator transcription factor [Pontibacter litorisediminis]|uniref:LytR/AlgR family response regulator transcription factor n=1 Tax=Pontibacter litorisediminis TaxID=1846260 RepID=UPI0023EAA286|nr:LytTR family DNA-binding domain-containing protein [Pontibacter litorisediminis]